MPIRRLKIPVRNDHPNLVQRFPGHPRRQRESQHSEVNRCSGIPIGKSEHDLSREEWTKRPLLNFNWFGTTTPELGCGVRDWGSGRQGGRGSSLRQPNILGPFEPLD